jgi:hypothetical protein
MADRRLSHGIAMACRPPLFLLGVHTLVRRHASVGPYEGPTTSSSSAVASRRIL